MRIAATSYLLAFAASTIAQEIQPSKRAQECIPLAGAVDDSPALQQALVDCGDGGNILIEGGKTYNIGSVIDFSSCKNCTIQIEGTLSLGSDISYWRPKDTIFRFQNTNGARIYSSTGTGLVKGNGPAYYEHKTVNSSWLSRWPVLFNLTNSSNIALSNIRVQNPSWSVFAIRSSQDIHISSVSVVVDEMKYNYGPSLVGYQIEKTTRISITNSTVKNAYEACIAVGEGTNSLTVDGFDCNSYSKGVVLDLEWSFGVPVKDVVFRNLRITGSNIPTGLLADEGVIRLSNITYDGVKLDNVGNAISWITCMSGSSFCSRYASKQDAKLVSFKRYEGTAKRTSTIACRKADGGSCNIVFEAINVQGGVEIEF